MNVLNKNIFKTDETELLEYTLNVSKDIHCTTENLIIREDKMLDIIEEICLKINEIIHFNMDNPDKIYEKLECCNIKLIDISHLIQENKDELTSIDDDLNMNQFLINCNMEDLHE